MSAEHGIAAVLPAALGHRRAMHEADAMPAAGGPRP